MRIERRVRFPLLDLSLFRNLPYVAVTLSGTAANIGLCVTAFGVTLYLQQVEGYSPAVAGLIFLGASAAEAVAGPLSGRLGERFHIPTLMAAAIALGALGVLVLAAGPPLALYVAALAAFGLGYGLCWSLTSVGTQTVVPTEQAGAASGLTLTLVIGIAGLGIAIAAALIEALTAGGTTGRGDRGDPARGGDRLGDRGDGAGSRRATLPAARAINRAPQGDSAATELPRPPVRMVTVCGA